MKTTVTIEINTDQLSALDDRTLAAHWHVAQANPAPMENQEAGELVEIIGREIIRRWLKEVPPELWHHQGNNHYWNILREHGQWLPVNGDNINRQWIPNSQ
jgi:hypothetical protein